jgi:hypothetical protein
MPGVPLHSPSYCSANGSLLTRSTGLQSERLGCREIHHFLTEPDYRGDKTIRCTTESILTGSLDQTILSGRPDGLAGRCSTFSVARLFLGK